MTRSTLTTAILLSLALSGCTSFRAYQEGIKFEKTKDWDQAVLAYTRAAEVDPDNLRFRLALQRAKLESSRAHFEKGKTYRAAALEAGRARDFRQQQRLNELAAVEFELVVKLDSTNQYAAVELAKVIAGIRESQMATDRNSLEERKRRAISKAQPPELNPASNEPISLSFPRETNVKDIYRALGNSFGINILFDQALRDDKITIELRDVTSQQALERVMQAANHFYKILDEKTIIIVPDNPQARRDYEDLVIRTFYLSNGDAEQVTNVVRTMIEARNVFPLKALNAITIRDTADKVRIAEKIIEANDKAKAEVVVDVELLQLDAGKLRDIGVQLSTQKFSQTLVNGEGAAITNLPISGDGFTIRDIGLDDFTFTIPSIAYSFVKTSSEAQLLAKPQLRISEGEKATLHIGQKRPVPVSVFNNITNTGGQNPTAITSFNYQDIGIKIAMEPRVHHNREVTLKLTVEVSNISGFVPGGGSTPDQPIIGTRTIESTIRLKDGETNFLAGLIRKDDSSSVTTIPFLGEIPVLGRLFTNEKKDHTATDVVLTMTPHIIRIPDITDDDLAPMWVGTQNNLTFRGVSPRLESQSQIDPFNNFPRTGEEPPIDEDEPQVVNPAPAPAGSDTNAPAVPIPTPGSTPSDPFRKPGASQKSIAPPLIERTGTPRIAPQPSTLSLKPGEEKLWKIVGMDLEGLGTNEMRIRFSPDTTVVSEAFVGEAMLVDLRVPPAITLDPSAGLITVRSTDGNPLRFASGGDILILRVRGGGPGNAMVVIESLSLVDENGGPISGAISGGRVKVE